ncbi:GGDEF domain-containing protein [Kineococcus radiotolerans]|uniref:Diguanylate cyclase n=1 Tax=Kineococcus radiotolerans (strain ATCC BAA-149 / DSM 14245 / SRS30216) TaxID=266940 RepID=A6WC75_KINRD|nr:GGDEF domain-containing protein [Kineococcus radiotolerans]ABS04414.1 diguanylate cyclase [Kineococcus radiotolerans SRS30216 = ATCC BAA-149]
MPAPSTGPRPPGARSVLLAVAALLAAACLVLPTGPAGALLYAMVACAMPVGAVLGLRRHRPRPRGGWVVLGSGLGLWAAGACVQVLPWFAPTPAGRWWLWDLPFLLGYPLVGAGVWWVARRTRPRPGVGGVIDVAVITSGVSVLTWAFVVEPDLDRFGQDPAGAVAVLAYPVLDLALLALAVGAGAVSPRAAVPLRLMTLGLLASLTADLAWRLTGPGPGGQVVVVAFLVSFLTWTAAVTHPAAARLRREGPAGSVQLTRLRLLALGAAGLLAPGTAALQLALGREVDPWTVVVGCGVLFTLVLARAAVLLEAVGAQAERLRWLSVTDELTGLPNRRSGREQLADRCAPGAAGRPVTIALLDLDHFKRFNDTRGHPAGDTLLRECADAWRARLPPGGHLARWGGEEFLLLCAAPVEEVDHLLSGWRRATPQGQTFSAGTAGWDGREPVEALVARADAALYEAKSAGRACTRHAPAPRGARRAAAG